LQIAISQINAEHMETGRFIVEFKGWEEIERILDQFPEVAQDKLTIVTNTQFVAVNDNLAAVASNVAEIKSAVGNNQFDKEISEAKEEIERRDFALAKQKLSRLRRDKWDSLTDEQRFLVLANPLRQVPARLALSCGGKCCRDRPASPAGRWLHI
jgi:hypothetical protein